MRQLHLAQPLLVLLLAAAALGACGDESETQPNWWASYDGGADATQDGGTGDASDATTEPEAPENQAPTAVLLATPEAGPAPLAVELNANESSDPDGTIVQFDWDFGDESSGSGESVDHSYAKAGCYQVTLTVTDDEGATATAETTIVATEGVPDGDPQVTFDAMPLEMAVVPRDLATNEGTVSVRGTVSSPGYDSILVEVTRGATVVTNLGGALCSTAPEDPFDVSVGIPVELENHDVSVYLVAGGERTLVQVVHDVVAGDVILVQGQSNAVATQQAGDANVNADPFLRSFGSRVEDGAATAADGAWRQAEGNANEGPGAVGQWTLRMGKLLVEEHAVPIAILNGARGGKPIDYFQRNDADPTDLSTNYGRLLTRVRAAGLDGAIRTIIYYQGESDGANAAAHHDGWIALHDDWLEDYPSIERAYVTQVRKGCGAPSPALRNGQRLLADEVSEVSVMSTTGLNGHDGCHFSYDQGYALLGARYAALLSRDLFGGANGPDIDAPNVERIFFSKSDGTEITVVLRDDASTMTFDTGAEAHFVVEGVGVAVASGATDGSRLVLTLTGDATGATGLTYVGHEGAGPWVTNATGIGLLAFHDIPIEPM